MDYIPYNQAADPNYLLSQGISNFLSGLQQQQQQKYLGQDVQAILNYAQNPQQFPSMMSGQGGPMMGIQPQMPQMRSPMGNQMMLQALMGNLMQQPITPYQRESLDLQKQRLEQQQINKGLSSEQRREFVARLNAAKTKEEIDRIFNEFRMLSGYAPEPFGGTRFQVIEDPMTMEKYKFDPATGTVEKINFPELPPPTSLSPSGPEMEPQSGGLLEGAGELWQKAINKPVDSIAKYFVPEAYGTKPYSPPLSKSKIPTPSVGPLKSPYPEYPDAYQENGGWYVMRNGKRYRIEP